MLFKSGPTTLVIVGIPTSSVKVWGIGKYKFQFCPVYVTWDKSSDHLEAWYSHPNFRLLLSSLKGCHAHACKDLQNSETYLVNISYLIDIKYVKMLNN